MAGINQKFIRGAASSGAESFDRKAQADIIARRDQRLEEIRQRAAQGEQVFRTSEREAGEAHDLRLAANKNRTGNIGTYNPRDYTTESFAKFRESGDPRILERYESQRNIEIGGVPHRFDPARGGYFPASVQPGVGGQGQGGQPGDATQGGNPVTADTVGESEGRIAQMKAERTPPTGFQLVDDGTGGTRLEPISGGPADIKARENENQQQAKQRRERALGTIVVQDMDRAENLLDDFGDGFVATQLRSRLADTPGTKAHDLNQLIEASRATVSLQNLQELKETTGAGLGNVSDKQSELLASAYGSIKLSQNKEQLKDSIRRSRNIYLDIIFGHGQGPKRKPLSFQDEWQPIDEGWVDDQGNPIAVFGDQPGPQDRGGDGTPGSSQPQRGGPTPGAAEGGNQDPAAEIQQLRRELGL